MQARWSLSQLFNFAIFSMNASRDNTSMSGSGYVSTNLNLQKQAAVGICLMSHILPMQTVEITLFLKFMSILMILSLTQWVFQLLRQPKSLLLTLAATKGLILLVSTAFFDSLFQVQGFKLSIIILPFKYFKYFGGSCWFLWFYLLDFFLLNDFVSSSSKIDFHLNQ